MSRLDVTRARERLHRFEFGELFIEELGWSRPADPRPTRFEAGGATFSRRAIAQLGGVVVFEVASPEGAVPDARARHAVHGEIGKTQHEHLLLFVDGARTQSLWSWVKRDGAKLHPRDHYFSKGQPGDLFLSKLASLVVDVTDFDQEGRIAVTEVAGRLKAALDVERVTKQFYGEFHEQHLAFIDHISGIASERDRRWYASVLLNRMMFITFLQKKHLLDGGNVAYLRGKLERSQAGGRDRFFRDFLKPLFFEGFARPERERSAETVALVGDVPYLDGGLFLPHRIEAENPALDVADQGFDNLLALFDRYSWNLNDTPGGDDNEINPDVLGYIFEKYINQKAFGAYYTRPEITSYLCEQTIYRLILDRVNTPALPGVAPARHFDTIEELLLKLDAPLCRELLLDVLPSLSVLDPACGSGAFLVAALKTLVNVYAAVIGKLEFLADHALRGWLRRAQGEHPSLHYWVKKQVVTQNLYGVDVMEEAVEIAKLRLFLALVASAGSVAELEPLPNIDFNVVAGNSLIGLLHVTSQAFDEKQRQGNLFRKTYPQVLEEKKRLIELFRQTQTLDREGLRSLRDDIERARREAGEALDEILLTQWQEAGIKLEQATWDHRAGRPGRPRKRSLTIADIQALQPFHWAFEFHEILVQRGGFDAIITNPPWEKWKPEAKEFFAEHSSLVTKNIMTIKEFEKEQAKLLADPALRDAWLAYLSRFPHVSAWFRKSPEYPNQSSLVDGKRTGSDVNLYKLFLERCFTLLGDGARCGILLPTGFYTDLGAKGLRELLFEHAEINALFGLSNERFIFEGVDHRFRICLLTFRKGGETGDFPAAFRMDPREAVAADHLERFLHTPAEHLTLSVDLIRKLSPTSLSLMELKTPTDIAIATKMLRFPMLGDRLEGTWNLVLTNEFHMTNDSHLFKTSPGPGRLPLFEGKMIWQFDASFQPPRFWVEEEEGRAALLGRRDDAGQLLDYQCFRLGFRDVASNTNERTMVATVIPPTFHGNKLPCVGVLDDGGTTVMPSEAQLTLCAIWNSLVLDWLLRMKVAQTLNFFYIYQLPVPRLLPSEPASRALAERAARLTCTTPDFAGLWQEVMATPWTPDVAATDPDERARLRAEIDALVAHLYALTAPELTHILSTFPLVPQHTKDAVLAAYHALAPTHQAP